jgi:uncharacterized protein (TIGR02246 family)
MNSGQTSSSKSHDEAAIRDLYQQTIEGWNKGSGDALAAPCTEDSDYIGFDGTYLKGRAEIASFHQMLFENIRNRQRQGFANDVPRPKH